MLLSMRCADLWCSMDRVDLHALTGRSLTEGDVRAVCWIAGLAEQFAEYSCETPKLCAEHARCTPCFAREAVKQLERLIDYECRTRHPERLTCEPERIYFDEWMKANRRDPARNHGVRLLEAILNPDLSQPAPAVSQHDAEIATTVIQWLGTSIGRAFIDTCEQRIKEEKASRYSTLRRHEIQRYVEMILPPSPSQVTSEKAVLRRIAETIAGKYQSLQDRVKGHNLADDIFVALHNVRMHSDEISIQSPDQI